MTPPLVTLHGFLGAPSLWAACLAGVALPVPVEHRWLPGHGPDFQGPCSLSFRQLVDKLAASCPPGSLLLGYSLGARLALAALAWHSERIAGVIAVGGHPGLESPTERDERARWDEEQAAQIEREGLRPFLERWESLPLFATQRRLPASTLDAQRAARLAHRPAAVAWAMRALGLGRMPPCAGELAAVRDRVTLVTGRLDQKFHTVAAELSRRLLVKHVIVEGAGHNVPLEEPGTMGEVVRLEVERLRQGREA